MTKKFLLFLTKDQRQPFDYGESYGRVMESIGGNSGNNVFQYSLQTILRNNNIGIETDLWSLSAVSEQRVEQMNSLYGAAVAAPANVISGFAVRNGCLERMTRLIRRLRIPVHIVSLGAQGDYDFSFDFLSECRKEASAFIGAVLDGGGKIGVRGYFTQEAVCKLGFSPEDCEVIGCPSIFINGGGLQVKKTELSPDELRPVFNGTPVWRHPQIETYFKAYPQSFFVDQEKFYRLLYQPWDLGRKELKYLADKNDFWLRMYEQDRIRFYGDYTAWVQDIRNSGVNFSFGSRIHGNILPLLQGIPAYITATDSRVRELAEYYRLPYEKLPHQLPDLYHFYEKADYKDFNRNFAAAHRNFTAFMQKCGLSVAAADDKAMPAADITLPSEQNHRLIAVQAQICRRSPLHYGFHVLYCFLKRCLRGEFRF